eukprot:1707744-Pyramimonas_sp.AAC.1
MHIRTVKWGSGRDREALAEPRPDIKMDRVPRHQNGQGAPTSKWTGCPDIKMDGVHGMMASSLVWNLWINPLRRSPNILGAEEDFL